MLLTPYLLSICIYNVEEVEMNWVHSSRKKKLQVMLHIVEIVIL
jgi:hypothetical protein